MSRWPHADGSGSACAPVTDGREPIAAQIASAIRTVVNCERAALHEPTFGASELEYVKDCVETGWVSSVGEKVDRFERQLGDFTGAHCAIATVNGTAALHICIMLAGASAGDEVVVPALSFVATANAVAHAGAIPHFADINERDLGLDAQRLDDHLKAVAELTAGGLRNRSTGRRISAAVVMHAFGHPADLDGLGEVCRKYGLALVEDAAESLGSFHNERHTGTVGLISAVSFNGNKIVTTGGGGAILTNDAELGRRAKHVTTTARVPAGWCFVHDEVGYNYRLPNLNAALGCAQMERLQSLIERKRRLANRYHAVFDAVDGVTTLREPPGCRSNYWLNNIILDRTLASERDAVLEHTNSLGLMTRPAWTPLHKLPMFTNCPRSDLSVTEDIFCRLISVPSSPRLAPDVA